MYVCVCAQVPIYDFKQSKRVGYTHVEPPEGRVVILEGIYALHGKIRYDTHTHNTQTISYTHTRARVCAMHLKPRSICAASITNTN